MEPTVQYTWQDLNENITTAKLGLPVISKPPADVCGQRPFPVTPAAVVWGQRPFPVTPAVVWGQRPFPVTAGRCFPLHVVCQAGHFHISAPCLSNELHYMIHFFVQLISYFRTPEAHV